MKLIDDIVLELELLNIPMPKDAWWYRKLEVADVIGMFRKTKLCQDLHNVNYGRVVLKSEVEDFLRIEIRPLIDGSFHIPIILQLQKDVEELQHRYDEAEKKAKFDGWEIGTRLQIAPGWYEEGKKGTVVGHDVFVEQFWTPILWDDEDDPDFHKAIGLEKERP